MTALLALAFAATVEERLQQLEADNARLKAEVSELRAEHRAVDEKITELAPLQSKISGYLDFGFFYAMGDGSGIRPDIGYQYFPQYSGEVPDSWVFMGDPLSTAVNARGEPADTGPSRAVTLNAIGNGGKASFIANSLTLALFGAITPDLSFTGAIDFLPRGRNVSNTSGVFLGDFIDVKLAYLAYDVPLKRMGLTLYAGKIDSLLGVEYKSQDAPDRLTVTPSLLCRYTCGRPLGLKARARFFGELINVMLGVTNGSYFVAYFPFGNQIDTNNMKTLGGRVAVVAPVGAGLEIGASAAIGAQDFQPRDNVLQWHVGADARLLWHDVEAYAEYGQGHADGRTESGQARCGSSPCLEYKSAYGLFGYHATNWLMPYARVDWRQALHQDGASFVYISRLVRATLGARVEIGTHLVLKAEYTFNVEIGGLPQIPNDIATSSLIVRY